MKTKFTKGEWLLCCGDRFQLDLIITGKERENGNIIPIAQIDFDFDGDVGVEQKANAHLISAAPEMYEMLESALFNEDLSDEYYNKIESLLAKARGENV